MSNPDFIGDVPSKRCETCKDWTKAEGIEHGFGMCGVLKTVLSLPVNKALLPVYEAHFWTTDLAVCSNWTKKNQQDE